MNQDELKALWSKTLRSASPAADLNHLARAVVDVYLSGDPGFRQHIKNRFNRVTETTGQPLDPESFDLDMARAFIADEVGFASWDKLVQSAGNASGYPMLFQYAIAALWRGDFTSLEIAVGGPPAFDDQIKTWIEAGYFAAEPETMAEAFAAACMLGHDRAAAFLLDAGVDPLAGKRTGLNGFHYAASSGRLSVVRLLIDRKVPMEIENMYGGTVWGQALWSAVNEHTPDHAAIIEALIDAGAVIEPGTLEWWRNQNVPSAKTKERVAKALTCAHGNMMQEPDDLPPDFKLKLTAARALVSASRVSGNKLALANALKELGNIERRPPQLRESATQTYAEAARLYLKLGLPLEAAWVLRHIGITLEYAERLVDAEGYYDESLALFRRHAGDNTLNYANTVRYPAVIKNRVGKRDESATLWQEAVRRYQEIGAPVAVAEGAAWLTIFAIEKGERDLALEWFATAERAAAEARDEDTDKWVATVRARLTDQDPDSDPI